jgi:hypothetical protein
MITQIDTAAWVRGYYRVAGHRFADNVLQNILGGLFKKIKAEIPGLLEGLLGLNEGDGMHFFSLAPPPQLSANIYQARVNAVN